MSEKKTIKDVVVELLVSKLTKQIASAVYEQLGHDQSDMSHLVADAVVAVRRDLFKELGNMIHIETSDSDGVLCGAAGPIRQPGTVDQATCVECLRVLAKRAA